TEHWRDRVAVARGVLIHSGRRRFEVAPLELAALCEPAPGAVRNVKGADLYVAADVRVVRSGTEIFGRPPAYLRQVAQQGLGVRLHLRVSKAVDHARHIASVDVGNPIGVP